MPTKAFRSAPLLTLFSAIGAYFVLKAESALPESKQINHWFPVDLRVYTLGGKAVAQGDPLYAGNFVNDLPFTYPPFAGVVFSLFHTLDTKLLTIAWNSLNFLSLVAVVLMVFARKRELNASLGMAAVAFSGLLFALEPIRGGFYYGQINLLIMFLVAIDFLPRNNKWAGIGVGIAAGLKLTPAFFLLLFVIQRRWKALGISLLTFAATVAVGFWRVRDASDFWTNAISDSTRVGKHTNPGAQSIQSLLIRVFSNDSQVLWAVVSVVVVLCCAAGLWWANRRDAMGIALGLAGMTSCLVSPFSWFHHWVWFAPLAAGILLLFDDHARGWFSAQALLLLGFAATALLLTPAVSRAMAPDLALWLRGEDHRYEPQNLAFIGIGVLSVLLGLAAAAVEKFTGGAQRRSDRLLGAAAEAHSPAGVDVVAGEDERHR